MEKFHFKYSAICALKMNIFEGKYSKTARDLRRSASKAESKEIIDQLLKFYSEKEPSIDQFKIRFQDLKYTNQSTRDKRLIQYIFSKFENYYRHTNELTISNFSLEHVDPQSNTTGNFGWIGNLIPIDKFLNEKCGSKQYIDKLPIYRQSDLKIVQQFISLYSSEKDWNQTNQMRWFEFIVDTAYNNVWKLEL